MMGAGRVVSRCVLRLPAPILDKLLSLIATIDECGAVDHCFLRFSVSFYQSSASGSKSSRRWACLPTLAGRVVIWLPVAAAGQADPVPLETGIARKAGPKSATWSN